MKLPKHINLSIEHQPHAGGYETIEEWARGGLADVTEGDMAEMLRTGDVWLVQWYPNTPVGFLAVAAATLERALELANAAEGRRRVQ